MSSNKNFGHKHSAVEIKEIQERGFSDTISYVLRHSAFYKEHFKKSGIDLNKAGNLSGIRQLPFTNKEELNSGNEDFLCVNREQVADYVTTSGSTGEPISFFLTKNDLSRLGQNEALAMSIAQCTSDDIFQLLTTIDKSFMAGMAYFQGVQALGAGIVRSGPGSPLMQWDSIMRFHPTVLITIPSFIIKMVKYAGENNIEPNNTSVKRVICIGEPIRGQNFQFNELGMQIRKEWNVDLFSTYASTEMGSAFTECEYGVGGHHQPEMSVLEVIDEDGNEVSSGEAGEVVVTTIGVEGLPLVRYRTNDICRIYREPCKCGRATPRLGPVIGRKQQMLKFKGTTVFPQTIFEILEKKPGISEFYVEAKNDNFSNDQIIVHLIQSELESIGESILRGLFISKLRVVPEFQGHEPMEIRSVMNPEKSRKVIKFVDSRL